MAPPHLDMMTSQPALMNSGKLEAVRTDHPKKIGSMPQKNCDLALRPVDPELCDDDCPKCGVEMEPIEVAVERLQLQQLRLCPGCYLVTWIDQNGQHIRQGVPMKRGFHPASEPGSLAGEPEEC
jgi:hypothetical protein